MKIRNLLLGSVAAAGLSTGAAYAADLGVLTSLDVCDNLGLSGLTISSDTNCLQITGEVRYRFQWGDYNNSGLVDVETLRGTVGFINGDDEVEDNLDWRSRFDAWIKFVASAESDFGTAKAVLKLKQVQNRVYTDELPSGAPVWTEDDEWVLSNVGSSDTGGVVLDEAYVAIGDATVISAGKKGSIMNKGDDEELNFLGLFASEKVDRGVSWGVDIPDGGHVIQVESDLGNGVKVAAGLEKLDGYGTAVGVIAYSGDGLSAHATVAAGGILDGEVDTWGIHAGFTGTFDTFKVVLAGAFGHDEPTDYDTWNVLASASATFDLFTIAGSFEAVGDDDQTDYGAGGSISAQVTDTVALNLGARWYHEDLLGDDNYQVAASVVAAVTESLTLTGEVGYVNDDHGVVNDLFYGSAKLAWAPGGGYTSSIKGTVTSESGYKIETEFKKTFE